MEWRRDIGDKNQIIKKFLTSVPMEQILGFFNISNDFYMEKICNGCC